MVAVATVLVSLWLVGISGSRAVNQLIHVLLMTALFLVLWKVHDIRMHRPGGFGRPQRPR